MRKIIAIILLFSFNSYAFPPIALQGQSGSALYPAVHQAPYSQITDLGSSKGLIETGSENMLVDPGMEATGIGAWTCVSGGCSKTSVSGEFSSGKQALKVALIAQALNVSQSVSTVSGIQAQGVVGALYKVPSAVTDFQVCSLVAGSEQTCVPATNLIADNLYHQIEIPTIITPGSSVGIKVKTTATYTQNIFIDAAYVKQGIGYQNLMLDNTYSVTSLAAGGISVKNTDWLIGSVRNSTGAYTLNFKTGLFNVAPTCTCTSYGGAQRVCSPSGITTAKVDLSVTNSGSLADLDTHVICQKSGNDYLASSSAVYAQSSAGTISAYSYGTPAAYAANAPVIFPTVAYDTRVSAYSTTTGRYTVPEDGYYQGTVFLNSNNFPFNVYLSKNGSGTVGVDAVNIAYTITATGAGQVSGSGILKCVKGDILDIRQSTSSGTLGAGSVSFTRVSGGGIVVGSFAGYTAVPGYQGNVDTFSVSFGTTNATTVCSASPCSYLDQIGTAVTSITRAATADYTLNLTKTYAKLKCTMMTANSGVQNGITNSLASTCTNCNSLRFVPINTAIAVDTYGTIMCQGSY